MVGGRDFGGYWLPQPFLRMRLDIILDMDNSQFDIRQFDWFELFRENLDYEDRKELDALAARANKHRAAIAVAGHPFQDYVLMLSFMLDAYKELRWLHQNIQATYCAKVQNEAGTAAPQPGAEIGCSRSQPNRQSCGPV